MVYFVDTNIFLRVIVKESESTFNDCLSFLKLAEGGEVRCRTSHLVLAEVVWMLSSYYRLPKQKSVASLQGIEGLGIKIIDDFHFGTALRTYRDSSVKYIDALIASIEQIQRKEWSIVSYDRDFDKIAVLRKEPGQVIKQIL